jgi:HEAT repeat protein
MSKKDEFAKAFFGVDVLMCNRRYCLEFLDWFLRRTKTKTVLIPRGALKRKGENTSPSNQALGGSVVKARLQEDVQIAAPKDVPESKMDEADQSIFLLQQPDRPDDPYNMVKREAIRKLGLLKSEKARDVLTRLAQDQDFFARLEAAEALGKMGDLHILAEWLGDKDLDVSYRAAEHLVAIGLEAIPILVEGLKHDTRWDASSWGIIIPLLEHGRSGFDERKLKETLQPAVPLLIDWIKRAHIQKSSLPLGLQVSRAVEALGKIGDVSALSVLENLLLQVNAALGGETIKEYVATSLAVGYVSSNSSVKLIREAIENIKRQSP